MKRNKRLRYGALIASMRKTRNLTQRELAIKSGVSNANIARIELGKYSPGLDIIMRIEEALGFKRIYINENKELMGTPYTLTMSAYDVEAFYNEIKDYPCFTLVEMTKDKRRITAVWNENFHDEEYEAAEEPEMIFDYLVCKNSDWACGVEEEYPVGTKLWWYECDIEPYGDIQS